MVPLVESLTGTRNIQSARVTYSDEFDGVRFDVADGIATITIDRPEAGNALTSAQRVRMGEWLGRADEDLAIRCVVLQATGRFFCTGADLRGGTNIPDAPERPADAPDEVIGDRRRMMLRGAIKTVSAILDCEVPVIAKVQGTAAGIGAHLAFACDLVIASENAKFIEVFARRALAADGLGTWLLPRLVGLQRAKELILLAEDIGAQRAYEIGLVARVVPAEELDDTVAQIARKLADGPTRAHAVNKWLLNRSLDVDRATLAQEEAWMVDIMGRSLDSEEGVNSFIEKREPKFRGY
jgi:2-(1,2-epoxy-1,2-dihydrophenyl)acetyl-CoA isomerase